MVTGLTREDVERLVTDDSPEARAKVAQKLGGQFQEQTLTREELAIAQDIVRVMAHDVAVKVRQSLAENIKRAPGLPHDVALTLAEDIESISLPILEYSNVLTDEDLVGLVRTGNEAKHQAIARRTEVHEMVSNALIELAGAEAVTTLINNRGAQIAEAGYQKAVDRFGTVTAIQESLVRRDKLPVSVAERLVTMVSETLRDYLVEHHELSAAMASDLVLQGRERAVINMVSSGSSEQEVMTLVEQLKRNDRLTPSLILRALCVGDIAFFEASMSLLSEVPMLNTRKLIHDTGPLGLKTLYDRSGLPMSFLPAVRVAIEVLHETPLGEDRSLFQRQVIERILTQFESMQPEDINYLLSKLSDIIMAEYGNKNVA